MTASHKIVALCLCLMLASFGVVVDAGHGMMGGLMGGGGKHGGGHGALETLLAAGLLAKLLRGNHHHHGHHHHGHHHHGHHHHHEGRSAYGLEALAVPYAYDLGYGGHGYGY